MWKRLNNSRGTKPPVNDLASMDSFINNPYSRSVHNTVNRKPSPQEDDYHEYLQPEPAAIPRRDEDAMPKGLPRLPFEPLQPPQAHQNQQAHFRPASSVYSQPSPNPVTTQFARDQYNQDTYNEEDVSPPSSPEYEVLRNHRQQYHTADRDVSPVDEMPDVSRLQIDRSNLRPVASNIPVLRKVSNNSNVVPRKEISERPSGRTAVNPRWDPYSGEITTSDRGKPQSVKPKEFAGVTLKPTGLPLGNTSSITGGAKVHTSFSDRIRNLKTKNAAPAERPEWKGATGRVKLIAPVADRHDLPPLSVPRRNVTAPVPTTYLAYSEPTTPDSVVPSRDAETFSAPAVSEPIRPMHEEEQASPSRIGTSAEYTTSAIVSPPMIVKTFVHSPSPTLRSPVSSPPPTRPRRDSTGTIERNFREALRDVSSASDGFEPYEQPASRFSVTTYAPSEAQSTPRPSTSDTWERPAMPSPPRRLQADNNSVLNRKRPQIGQPMPQSISRKAINPGAPLFISMSSSVASRRGSASSATKNLPITPAEAQSHDLVTSLQAQLDALQNRRINISRGIRQMTELMPKDHIILTEEVRRKRENEKIKVEQLRSEEADVRREEHDVGLKLHRAYKRRDKNAVYEPTALWVRRVT